MGKPISWGRVANTGTVIGLAASILGLVAAVSSFSGAGYSLTPAGSTALFIFASLAAAGAMLGVWREPTVWRGWMALVWVSYGAAFGMMWPPNWIPFAAACVLLVLGAILLTRLPRKVAAAGLVMFASLLALFGLAWITLGLAFDGLADATSYDGAVSPSGALIVRTESVDPGAMGSVRVSIGVVPRALPLVEKLVYVGGSNLLQDGSPVTHWQDDQTLVIDYSSVPVFGRVHYSSEGTGPD